MELVPTRLPVETPPQCRELKTALMACKTEFKSERKPSFFSQMLSTCRIRFLAAWIAVAYVYVLTGTNYSTAQNLAQSQARDFEVANLRFPGERAESLVAPTTEKRVERKVAVCSTTQVADFTRQVVGDRWDVICVLGAGQDPHTYEVGSDDLVAVRRANLCLQNGWHLEGNDWMRVLAEKAGKPLVTCVDFVSPLKLPASLSSSDGRQAHDPHAWFDVQRAMVYVTNVLAAVEEVDPSNSDYYRQRAGQYLLQLRELDCWIKEQVNAIPRSRRVLITHHDAFGYFCEAYGFRAITPVGWTTGEFTDVTIDQRQLIIREIRRLGVKSIFVESSINRELLQGIARDAGVTIGGTLYSDAMGPVGSSGENYIGMMRHNVMVIVEHLK